MGIDEYSILKKKPKKNAFAATALLISIAIALLVMVGAVLVLGKVNDNDRITSSDSGSETSTGNDTTCEGLVKEIVFNDNIDTIKEAAISYFTNERLPQTVGETKKLTLKDMLDKKLIRTVRDASAKACDDNKSYVEVTKEENEYIMKIYLSCSDIEDYIIVHLGCYDYCDKDVCEKKEETPKTYEYEYKKTTACEMSPWSNWGNWKTTREKTSNLKKEDIKTEKTSKDKTITQDAIANVSYNCKKYGDEYQLVGTNCVKATTITKSEKAEANPTTYNCNIYSKEYKLVGNECVRNYTETKTEKADANPTTYNCKKYGDEYNLVGNECVRNYTETVTKKADYSCSHLGSDYKLSGTSCVRVVDAEDVHSTKTVTEYYTCYKKECTTKTVFSCPSLTTCGDELVTTCENVKKTCAKKVQQDYVSDHKCSDTNDILSQDKDGKYICTSTKSAKPVCGSGYTVSGTNCVKQEPRTDRQKAEANPTTYNCDKWKGYTKVGTTCTKDEPRTDKQKAEANPTTYNCNKWPGYDISGSSCVKVEPSKDTKNADEKTTYSCPVGYDYNDNNKTCSTKVKENVTTTYYRYATRTCTGGSTSIKWSTSQNDSILKGEGYKLTGNKREIKEIIK